MSGAGVVSQHCMATTRHVVALALNTNTVQKTLCKLAFVEPDRDSLQYLTADHSRLSPDGFWCQNHRESDPAHYLRRYRNVFLRTGGAPECPDIAAIQRRHGPVNETMNIKRRK